MTPTIGQAVLLGATLFLLWHLVVSTVLYGGVVLTQKVGAGDPDIPAATWHKATKFREAYPKLMTMLAGQLLRLLFLVVVLHAFGIVGP